MAHLHWITKEFDELNNRQLYQILALRSTVFVLEQSCLYQDMDHKDQHCHHVMGIDAESGALAAYARIVPPGITFPELSIGRVITSPAYRGQGLGIELMNRSIELCSELFSPQNIRISAQAHLQKFYGSLGFISEGEIYLEDGIDHVAMLLPTNL